MAKTKKKRRLTKQEIAEVREWMDKSPQGRKPTIRQIAKRYGVNQPSVVKSLGGWKGIQRGRPEPDKERKFLDRNLQSPIEIEEAEMKVPNIELPEGR